MLSRIFERESAAAPSQPERGEEAEEQGGPTAHFGPALDADQPTDVGDVVGPELGRDLGSQRLELMFERVELLWR